MYKYILLSTIGLGLGIANAQAQIKRSINASDRTLDQNVQIKTSNKAVISKSNLNSKVTPKAESEITKKPLVEDDITGFLETPNGLLYKFIKKGTSKKTANVGDQASLHIEFKMGDTTIINSRRINDNKPVIEHLKSPKYNGDVSEGILMLKPGDIAIFKLLLSDLEAKTNHKTPPYVKQGKYATWTVEMTDLKTNAEIQEEEKKLILKEEEQIKTTLAKNKVKAERLESGVYIVRHNKGTGEIPKQGNTATVNYTGKLMDGTAFDSNVDPKFNHVSPFKFPVGTGRVIKGWDAAFLTMKKGEKATIYIPSSLAYGKQSPSQAIPANSILVFDVELVDFESDEDGKTSSLKTVDKEQELLSSKEEEEIKYIITKNKQKAERLENGVYIVRHNKVSGPKPAKGNSLTVNYTGKLMDGKSFDSNVDPKFNHVSPFQFNVGTGSVIKGWDIAFPTLSKGEKATIYIPSASAYGKRSPSPAIPANSILVFDIELVDFESK